MQKKQNSRRLEKLVLVKECLYWLRQQSLILELLQSLGLESGTSNLFFIKDNKVFSPTDKFYKGITYKFFKSKIKKIYKKDILVNSLKEFDEILLIGSGKGVTSVQIINEIKWKRKSLKFYNILFKHYNLAINNCPKYK